MLNLLRIDVLPKIAALLNFVVLALKFRFEQFRVVTLLVMVDVGLLLYLLAWQHMLGTQSVTADYLFWLFAQKE